jgi:hypothetical protein
MFLDRPGIPPELRQQRHCLIVVSGVTKLTLRSPEPDVVKACGAAVSEQSKRWD